MEYLLFILWFLTIIFCIVICYNNKKKKDEEFKKLKEDLYVTEKQKIVERIEEELAHLNREIEEKQTFNGSLLKLREEEVDRLIETQKKERLHNLENELLIEKQKKLMNINAEVSLKTIEAQNSFNKFFEENEEAKKVFQEELIEIKKEVEDFRLRRESINQAILREKELQEKEDFYRVNIAESAQEDIVVLEQIRPRLKNREALSKLIWEVFIQRPTTEMIKRVTAGRDVSGIYKITYIGTGEAYIGKTTNIKTRWQNHIKTAIGLEGAAHSSLHTHMEKHGIWNYTFEILEEVSKDKLTEREKFYINLYDTTKQLNMREG